MKIGIYGGTFDPIHIGHLILAETVREKHEFDEIVFVPAYINPHKQGQAVTPPKSRIEMVRFAIAGNPHFRLNEFEAKRKSPSYTIDTLQKIHEERPEAELFLLMGSDTVSDFPNWKDPEKIQALAKLIVVNRGDEQPVIAERLDHSRIISTSMPAIDVSATEIRSRCATGKSIRYVTPRSVELFISANSLYAESASDPTEVPSSKT